MTAPAERSISPLACLGLLLFTLLCYFQFPGHVFLESDTQIYLPMLERFRDPSLFQRDPMVVRAHTAFSLYDELALGLNRLTGLEFETVLGLSHVAVRFTLLLGVFLITRAMGLSSALAVACAGIYALGGRVLGPSVLLVEYEPVPRAFALGPVMLATGFAAHGRFVAGGLAGAAGFLLHATTAAPFWIVYAALLFVPDETKEMKARLWGLVPLAAAVVILKLASSLQPGIVEPQALLSRLDEEWERLIRLRAPYVLVSLWPKLAFWQFGLMAAVSGAAYWRLRLFIHPVLRFFLAGLIAVAALSLPASYLLLEQWKWAMMPQWQPTRAVLFVQLSAMLLGLVLAFELGCKEKRMLAAWWWAAAGVSAGFQPRLLLVLAPLALAWLVGSHARWAGLVVAAAVACYHPFGLVIWKDPTATELLMALVVSGLLVLSASLSLERPVAGAAAVATVVAASFFVIPGEAQFHWSGEQPRPELSALSRWARDSTDKNTVFLFADAGRSLDPGVFRARSQRAVYVDWKSGGQINFFREFTRLWWSRWQQTMADPFRAAEIPRFRELGIDYLVLQPKNRMGERKTEFENGRYLVYALQQ